MSETKKENSQPKAEKTPQQINDQIVRIGSKIVERAERTVDLGAPFSSIRTATHEDGSFYLSTNKGFFRSTPDSGTIIDVSGKTGSAKLVRGNLYDVRKMANPDGSEAKIVNGVGTIRSFDSDGVIVSRDMNYQETISAAAEMINKGRAEVASQAKGSM